MLDVPKLHRDAEISNVSHKNNVTNLMSNPKKCNFKSFNPFSQIWYLASTESLFLTGASLEISVDG